MIQVQGLVKKYGSLKAVDELSFEVNEGEIFGLLGPNGAGKTTTISILSTLLAADGGSAKVCGYDVARDQARVRSRIGVVPQEIALYEDLSARENLTFWGRLYGMGGKTLKRRVDELLAITRLQDRASEKVEKYSGGMKRRLNLAIGLVHSPEVLFLDEPTVGIDAQARSRILELIREMNEDGLTVLYTTHYLEEAEQLCDRIAVIDQGKLVALGNKDDLIQQIGDVDLLRFAVPEEKVEEIQTACVAWNECKAVAQRRGKLEIQTADGALLLPKVQELLATMDLPLEQLEVERPNLETLYLNLTGRALRE
ncbi:MAG: ABC transporter ATP-binding protein [bacterium]